MSSGLLLLLLTDGVMLAYIGPGAGFAFVGSLFVLLAALGLVFVSLATWPFRLLLGWLLGRKRKRRKTGLKRLIILGLDGMDPRRVDRLLDEGRLPNFKRLNALGCSSRIESTCPPISPVAWSSFMTGSNPGKHNIFDFLNRDLRTYVPELSSSSLRQDSRGRPVLELLRKSVPFWKILGDYRVFSTVLRVPITFPPEKFRGLLLSGMCVPDLRGSQGTFTCFAEVPPAEEVFEGGVIEPIKFDGDVAHATLTGPPDPDHAPGHLRLAIAIRRRPKRGDAEVRIGRKIVTLCEGEYSEWVTVSFRAGRFARVHGICRLLLVSKVPFRLYVTPLNIDPENPALPVSHPNFYSIYLAKLHGPFATLGLAEDTWAHTEGIIDDDAFLRQTYDIHDERERMFFGAIQTTRRGACVCVFDTPDRLQHMFMRRRDAEAGTPLDPAGPNAVLDTMYERMDALVGRTLERTGPRDILVVLSDHGFSTFARGVNLNSWLRAEGFFQLEDQASAGRYLRGVDWGKTSAYTFGLAGLYLNVAGREAKGIVARDAVPGLKEDLSRRLLELVDPANGQRVVHAVHDAATAYKGPYSGNGPDLIVGFAEGYRASWRAAAGEAEADVFSDNTSSWSGDHCIDRALVPGIFYCNRRLELGGRISLIDIAPSVLDWFGVPVPEHMDGKICPLARPPSA